jgi:hypothetical protein
MQKDKNNFFLHLEKEKKIAFCRAHFFFPSDTVSAKYKEGGTIENKVAFYAYLRQTNQPECARAKYIIFDRQM